MKKLTLFIFLLASNAVFAEWKVVHPFNKDDQLMLSVLVQKLNTLCKSSQKIEFSYMPPMVQAATPGEIARMNNPKWIEVNPQEWKKLKSDERAAVLWHELGHSLGLEHSGDNLAVMGESNVHNAKELNWTSFYAEFAKACKK